MKKSKWVWLLFCCLVLTGIAFTASLLQGNDDPQALDAQAGGYMWQVLYTDVSGNLHHVMEDGTWNKVVVKDTKMFVEAVAQNEGMFIFSVEYSWTAKRIFSATLDFSQVYPLATINGRNEFLAYDRDSRMVLFTQNYDQGTKYGTFYSVPIWGGNQVRLADKKVCCEIVGDRFVYQVEPFSGNRELVSIKLDGTGKTNLTWTNYDEEYCGKIGDKVIFSRLVNGQRDLYLIPSSGGSGNLKTLANSSQDECYAPEYMNDLNPPFYGKIGATPPGVTASKAYYYLNQNRGWKLCSVNLDGSGKTVLATTASADTFIGSYGNWGVYVDGPLFGVTQDGTFQVQYPVTGPRWMDFACIMENRAIYNFGAESSMGTTVISVLLPGDFPIHFTPARQQNAYVSWDARRIIIVCKNEIKSVMPDGNWSVYIGSSFPATQPKVYLFSTGNRHIYAVRNNTRENLWTLYSERLNSGYLSILGENIPEANLARVKVF